MYNIFKHYTVAAGINAAYFKFLTENFDELLHLVVDDLVFFI